MNDLAHLSSSKHDTAVTQAQTRLKAENFASLSFSIRMALENVKPQSRYIIFRMSDRGLSGEHWGSFGTGGPLHAGLPESRPKH